MLKLAIEYIAVGVEAAAAAVIALAVLSVLIQLLPDLVSRNIQHLDAARLRLGRWLAMALELTLAADILRTAVSPSWDDIGKLAAIAALRTALNFFLEREIRNTSEQGA